MPFREFILIFYASFCSLVAYFLTPTPFPHPLNSYSSLSTPQCLLSGSLPQPRRREAQGRGPFSYDPTLWSLLCKDAWQAATQCLASLPRPRSACCQQHPYLPGAEGQRGRGAEGVARSVLAHPHPWVNLQSPGEISCDTSETVGTFAAAQQPQVALSP